MYIPNIENYIELDPSISYTKYQYFWFTVALPDLVLCLVNAHIYIYIDILRPVHTTKKVTGTKKHTNVRLKYSTRKIESSVISMGKCDTVILLAFSFFSRGFSIEILICYRLFFYRPK